MEPQVNTGAFECGFLRSAEVYPWPSAAAGHPLPRSASPRYGRDGNAATSVVSHRAPGSSASGQRQRQVSP